MESQLRHASANYGQRDISFSIFLRCFPQVLNVNSQIKLVQKWMRQIAFQFLGRAHRRKQRLRDSRGAKKTFETLKVFELFKHNSLLQVDERYVHQCWGIPIEVSGRLSSYSSEGITAEYQTGKIFFLKRHAVCLDRVFPTYSKGQLGKFVASPWEPPSIKTIRHWLQGATADTGEAEPWGRGPE